MEWRWLLLTWVEDGTGAALAGPGLRVQSCAASLDLHLRVLVQNLLDLDLHLGMGASVMSRHHPHHQHCQNNRKFHKPVLASQKYFNFYTHFLTHF